ncbi:PH domain-containing protein [Nanohaloarchaea archaeon]|nr:PH domain-containing protein [Candidatus Nanohaloarchaea archaeon]
MAREQMEWLSLDSGEQLVWQGQPRIKSILPAVLIGIPTAILGIGILIIAGAYLSVKNTKYVVSSEGLYVKKGVLSRSVQKIGFDKVQNISFSQGILGNYFGYGNVEISTAGGSGVEMRFRSIRNPKEIQQKINNRIKSTGTKEEGASSGRGQEELLEEILSELKEINNKI